MAGFFLTFEGIEGSGKTTQMGLLASELRRTRREVVTTREPGGTLLGRTLRKILLEPSDDPIDAVTELLLYAADRRQHVTQVIRPALERGAIVLCDRYIDSTLAYQGFGRELDLDRLRALNRLATDNLMPRLTIVLDVSVTVGLERAESRNMFNESLEGRFEAEDLRFHRRVHEGYLSLALAEPERFACVDGTGSVEKVFERVLRTLAERAPQLPLRLESLK